MEVSGQPHTSAALSLEKSLQYPLNKRLGGTQSWLHDLYTSPSIVSTEMKEGKMGWVFHSGRRHPYRILVGKLLEKEPPGRMRSTQHGYKRKTLTWTLGKQL